jgi:hypothetical protein
MTPVTDSVPGSALCPPRAITSIARHAPNPPQPPTLDSIPEGPHTTAMNSPTAGFLALATLALPMWAGEPRSLFDGKTLRGWEGDPKIWSVQDGAITAGRVDQRAQRNEFLASTRSYTNFVLRLQFKIEGTEGFVNSGVQIRSERIPNHHEMVGYQADIGEGWYGALYDESRRNTILAKPDPETVKKAVKPGQWNEYEIRADGNRVVLKINGIQTVDYTEKDPKVVPHGKVAVQIHGDGKTRVQFKDISLEELP